MDLVQAGETLTITILGSEVEVMVLSPYQAAEWADKYVQERDNVMIQGLSEIIVSIDGDTNVLDILKKVRKASDIVEIAKKAVGASQLSENESKNSNSSSAQTTINSSDTAEGTVSEGKSPVSTTPEVRFSE